MRRQRTERRQNAIIVVFIAGIMITSVIGYMYGSSKDYETVDGRKYYRTDNGWLLTIEGKQYHFGYLPDEVGVEIPSDAAGLLKSTPMVYITYDPDVESIEAFAQVQYDIGLELVEKNIYVENAFTGSNAYNRPVVSCENATSSLPVLYLKQSENLSVSLEGGCIIASSSPSGLLRLRDAFVYSIMGIP